MEIKEILKTVVHPTADQDIVSMGMVEHIVSTPEKISFTIRLTKPHDPAASAIRRAAERAVADATGITPSIIIADPAPQNPKEEHRKQLRQNTATGSIKKILAISSGKGGVGKSSVTANLAVELTKQGYTVGVLDADIYGPSMPKMFGVEHYSPIASEEKTPAGDVLILPVESHGVKVMSIGFFIQPTDALVWRGPMATSALRQLIHQTQWGELDFLLIDLPPGTGDVHLTVVGEIKIDAAIIVTTPQMVALADVVRGIAMFKAEHVNIPVLGIIENMAYFTPPDAPDKKYYVFGRDKAQRVAQEAQVDILGEIPLLEPIAEHADNGTPVAMQSDLFAALARRILEKLGRVSINAVI